MKFIKKLAGSKLLVHTALVFLSVSLTLVGIDLFVGFFEFSNGTGSGAASKRWFERNWKPVNEFGFRDFQVQNVPKDKRSLFFLGDSFTAGYGVTFHETYYYITRDAIKDDMCSFNLGKNGASTIREKKVYTTFKNKSGITPDYVVHQYFINDIEDYIKRPRPEPLPPFVRFLSRYSNVFEVIGTMWITKSFGDRYFERIKSAYADNSTFTKHIDDINSIHNMIRSDGANVCFLLFPFLNSKESTAESSTYLHKVAENFLKNCKQGDVLIDVSHHAMELEQKDKVVNLLDAHPSPTLHKIVAEDLIGIFSNASIKNTSVSRCF